jgi:TetR/AcrR family transcriptional regulator, cholesterol catabolism regulator
VQAMERRTKARPKGLSKRQGILDAAAKVLADKGFAGMTLQDVANEIGIYAASIYYYFPSREDLVREVAFMALDKFQFVISNDLEALPPEASPLDRVKQAIRSMVTMYTSQDQYFVAYERIVGQVPQPLAADMRERRLQIRQLWIGLLEQAQVSGQISPAIDLKLLRFIILGATQWVAQWYDPAGGSSPDAIAETYVDVILNGATPRG